MSDAIERFLDRLEESQANRVFCGECMWLAHYEGKPCFHPNAEVEVVTPLARTLSHQSALERNWNNACPDFEAGPNVFAREALARQEREAAEAEEYRALVLSWWMQHCPRLTRCSLWLRKHWKAKVRFLRWQKMLIAFLGMLMSSVLTITLESPLMGGLVFVCGVILIYYVHSE